MASKKTVSIRTQEQDPSIVHYEAALKLMHERKFDKAREAFRKLLEQGAPQYVCDRVRVHLGACETKLNDARPSLKSAEEQYDSAVVCLNEGRVEEARAAMERIVKAKPDADFAHYGLAVLHCGAGRVEESLRHLERAIELNPRNRIQARNDGDFQTMGDDPRFTEVLYPESAADTVSSGWRS